MHENRIMFHDVQLFLCSALALSAASRAESLRNSLQEERRDLTTFQVTIFILLLIITVVVLLLHFAEAWKVLPGAHLISGIGMPRVEVRQWWCGVVWFRVLFVACCVSCSRGR